MINIAQITLSMGTGGIENLILNISRSLNKERFKVCVVCLDFGGDLFNKLKDSGIECIVENRQPGLDWQLIFRLASLFRQKKFQIIHSHNQASCFYASLAAFLAGTPISITTEHSRHNTEIKWIRRFEKKILSLLQKKWVTVSEELAEIAKEKEGIKKQKIETITNGINYEFFSPNKLKKENSIILKEMLGLNSNSHIIIMVARLVEIKNHKLMFQALKILKQFFSDISLLLVGDGEYKNELIEEVADNQLSNNVYFLGNQDDIPSLLAISDVFVLCSHSEGLPLSLLEACAAGVPVVITKESNRAGLIKNEENGTVVQGNANSLATGIKDCLLNKGVMKKLSINAQQNILENYSLSSTVQKYEKLYDELIIKKGIKGC